MSKEIDEYAWNLSLKHIQMLRGLYSIDNVERKKLEAIGLLNSKGITAKGRMVIERVKSFNLLPTIERDAEVVRLKNILYDIRDKLKEILE